MDRFGARPVALFGSIVLTLGTLGMSLVAMDTWIWWVSICQFIRQIGMGFLLMPITTWSLNCLNGPSEVSAGSIGDEYRASDCGRCGRTRVGDSDGNVCRFA